MRKLRRPKELFEKIFAQREYRNTELKRFMLMFKSLKANMEARIGKSKVALRPMS